MRNVFRLFGIASTTCLVVSSFSGCDQNKLEGPQSEVKETNVTLDLPPVPEFKNPTANPDGSHPVAEMLLKANKFLDTEVKVSGHIVWIYDCATALRTPEMTEKDVKTLLEKSPEKCTRPHFIIADAADSPPDRGVWVVEYPRALRKDELKAYADEMIAEEKAKLDALPEFKLGDQITVTGQWTTRSPRGFSDLRGLVVYSSMTNNSAPVAE